MRTNIKVLSALVGLASFGAVVAQAQVYSQNVVGYVNSVVPPVTVGGGFAILANPLSSTNTTVDKVLPTAPFGTSIWTWKTTAPVGFLQATYGYYDDDGNPVTAWDNPGLTLAPGTGFWIKNPATTNLTITWVGEVLQGNLTNQVVAGYQILGNLVPQSGALDSVHGYVPSFGDTIYFWRNGGYVQPSFGYYDDDGNPVTAWDQVPEVGVGEGFWLKAASSKAWSRTFNVQ